jgi:hypothetical protein
VQPGAGILKVTSLGVSSRVSSLAIRPTVRSVMEKNSPLHAGGQSMFKHSIRSKQDRSERGSEDSNLPAIESRSPSSHLLTELLRFFCLSRTSKSRDRRVMLMLLAGSSLRIQTLQSEVKKILRGMSPRENYTGRDTAACQRS